MADALPRTRAPLVALLEERGLRLRRRDGQNFLVEPSLADAIVADAGVARTDHVVEIGPGAGALTQPLLARAGAVTAVELDRGLAELLRERLGGDPRLRLVHGDALEGEEGLHPSVLEAIASPRGRAFARTLVVSNLPYSVGTEVVVRLLALGVAPESVTAMLQREVTERLLARPATEHYGPLAILAALRADVRVLRRVPASAFHPRPDVESVVFRLVPRPLDAAARALADRAAGLARTAFLKRRKTLANGLADEVSPDDLARAGLDPSARPETVAPEGWLALAGTAPRRRARE